MVQVKLTSDVEFVNSLVNHPKVYPWVHGDIEGPLDMGPALALPGTIVLRVDNQGAFIFVQKDPKTWEVHTQFVESGQVKLAAKAAAVWMFSNTDADAITTMVPKNNKAARKLAKSVGFKYTHSAGDWPTDNGRVPLEHFKLVKEDICPQQQ